MISNENKKLAQWAMNFALRNGCSAARIAIHAGSNTSFELRDVRMDRLQQSSENRMTFSLFVDGRFGTFSTNRLNRKELEQFIRNGIDSTRYLAVDEARTLPDPSRFYKGGKPDLKLLDPNFNLVNPDDKVRMAEVVGEEAMDKDKRIISVQSTYSDGDGFSYQITSNGFEGETASSWYSLSASVSVRGEGEARPSGWWFDSALFLENLTRNGIGARALERALEKIGQRNVPSGRYTMVIDPTTSGRLLNPMISATFGSALQQRNSFLLDRLDTKVGNEKFTLIDNPHIIGASGARYFDGEGVATERRVVFDQGILKTYFIDTYNANKMEVEPTISAPSILELQSTVQKDLQGLIAGIDKGILVTGFNGGNSNSSTGNFSFGIEGFLIERGSLTIPISEMNITGNMLTLWSSLAAVGNDPMLNRSWRVPSLVFNDVDFSGS